MLRQRCRALKIHGAGIVDGGDYSLMCEGHMDYCKAGNEVEIEWGEKELGACVCCGFFFSSRRRHTRFDCDWSSDVCSSDLWPTFVASMNHPQAPMYPPKAYADKETAYVSKNPIGTGPYRFVRWSKDEEIVLEANEGYFRGAPRIKTVVFKPIPDDAVRVAAVQNREGAVARTHPPPL